MTRGLRIVGAAVACGLLACGCDRGGGAGGGASGKKRIAVIPKGLTHDFWKSVEAGARKAAAEIGTIEVDWKGPPKEDDTRQQIELVQNFVSGGVNGIVLAPLSDEALLSPVRLAVRAGIPVVIIDSALAGQVGKDFVSYVGTNNYVAGTLAGKRMAELMAGRGTVMILRYAESSASTNERERGFLDTLAAQASDVALIDPPQFAGADVNSAKRAAENMITAHLGKFDGVFCPNESSSRGMLLALEDRQLAGKVKFVGFDSCPPMIAALRAGTLHGFVVQNPMRMGYLGVKTMVDHLAGRPVQPNIDTGAVVVTADNMDQPEIWTLISPALDE